MAEEPEEETYLMPRAGAPEGKADSYSILPEGDGIEVVLNGGDDALDAGRRRITAGTIEEARRVVYESAVARLAGARDQAERAMLDAESMLANLGAGEWTISRFLDGCEEEIERAVEEAASELV